MELTGIKCFLYLVIRFLYAVIVFNIERLGLGVKLGFINLSVYRG